MKLFKRWNKKSKSDELPSKANEFLYEPEVDAPMYLLDVDVFSKEGKFLRQDIALKQGKLFKWRDLGKDDLANIMIVFISHRWLNTDSDKPDSDDNFKFKIVKLGLDMLKRQSGGNVRIMVWLDYSCMDQLDRIKMASGIASLPAYVERSSVILSPILPNDYYTQEEIDAIDSLDSNLMMKLTENMSPEHKDIMRKYSHLLDMTSRGWIRLEEYLASNVPFHGREGLQYDFFGSVKCHRNDRPHFLITPELTILDPLPVLPRLSNQTAKLLDPVNGKLFNPDDVAKIKTALDVVKDYVDLSSEEKYKGDVDDDQLPHGKGKKVYASGAIYEGEWEHGLRNGTGTLYTSNGNRYEGDWCNDEMHGQGILTYVFGDYHEGGFEHNHRSGKGRYVYTNGCAYYGSWEKSVPCDPNAYYTMPNGTPFESEKAAHDYMAKLTNVETETMGIEGQKTAFVNIDGGDTNNSDDVKEMVATATIKEEKKEVPTKITCADMSCVVS